MRRVRLAVAASLDGYIAGPNGEVDWVVMDPEIDFGRLMQEFDTVIMGRKTYDEARKQRAQAMPMRTFVFSRTLAQEDFPNVIVSSDPTETVNALKAEPGKDIWLFGGGDLFRSMLALGLIDSVEIAVMPVLLGGGVPLLPPPSGRAMLKLTHHHVYPATGTVSLEYVPE